MQNKFLLILLFLSVSKCICAQDRSTVMVPVLQPATGENVVFCGNIYPFNGFVGPLSLGKFKFFNKNSDGYVLPLNEIGTAPGNVHGYGFIQQDIRTVYTSSYVDLLLKQLRDSVRAIMQNNSNLIDTFSRQLNGMPCQMLIDENSPCYQNLVQRIMGEFEKKYVLVPKNQQN